MLKLRDKKEKGEVKEIWFGTRALEGDRMLSSE